MDSLRGWRTGPRSGRVAAERAGRCNRFTVCLRTGIFAGRLLGSPVGHNVRVWVRCYDPGAIARAVTTSRSCHRCTAPARTLVPTGQSWMSPMFDACRRTRPRAEPCTARMCRPAPRQPIMGRRPRAEERRAGWFSAEPHPVTLGHGRGWCSEPLRYPDPMRGRRARRRTDVSSPRSGRGRRPGRASLAWRPYFSAMCGPAGRR